MGGAVPVAWLAPEGAPAAAPGDEARRELAAWAKARGVEIAPPREADAPAIDAKGEGAVAAAVEAELAHVRDALAGLEFDSAERALARAAAALRDHAELPQAAWLRAEVERAWSARWLRGGDEERAKRAWQRAAGLDGGRAPGLGEKGFEPALPVTTEIRLIGGEARPGLPRALRLDGALAAPGEVRTTEGEHALAIVDKEGRAVWAAWVSFAEGGFVRIDVPPPPACSDWDLAAARLGGAGVRADGVRCGAWVAALADPRGRLRIALCAEGECAPFIEWRPSAIEPLVSDATPAPAHFRWPPWATWTLVGVGAAATALGVAAAAGAFRSSPQSETDFVSGGAIVVH